MAKVTSRTELKDHCLRRLGWPVVEVNVDDDQLDDRIDEALEYYRDYHFDATEKVYFKYQITANNSNDKIYDVQVVNGGSGYDNNDIVVYSGGGNPDTSVPPAATITTDANGTIISVDQSSYGDLYGVPPTVTVTTGTGSGAVLQARLGGFIEIPENIMGIVRFFDISSATSLGSVFGIQYQIVLNDLYNLSSTSLVPYYMTFQHLRLIEELLVGQQPFRYNRHKNICHFDTNWSRFNEGQFLIMEAYEVVDPNVYADVWDDRWLKRYCTTLFKRQWGYNTKKYGQMQLPGGMYFNGQQIYDEALKELEQLEDEMINSYSLPLNDMMGVWAPLLINTGIGASALGLLYKGIELGLWNSLPMA